MKKIPHDYYLKFLDGTVFDEVGEFHNKTNYIINDAFSNISYLHNIPPDVLATLSGNELRLYPDMDLTVTNCNILPTDESDSLSRNRSCDFFQEVDMEFERIEKLFEPIVGRNRQIHNRGYPSGGALYPTEIFVVSLSDNNMGWPTPEKVLHLLPSTRTFEIVQGTICNTKIRQAILPTPNTIGNPNFALVYMSYIPKVLLKYRYRGYRLAHLEVGSLYMLIDLMCASVGLANRVWSGYCDNMVSKSLGLNPTLFYPLCVQLIGEER